MRAGLQRSPSQSSIEAASSTKRIVIVTTAAPPWLTGTAVNPALRAAYLAKKGHKVTLMVPFLNLAEQPLLFPNNLTFDSPSSQKAYVYKYLTERTGFDMDGLDILFYPGRYDKLFCSIIPTGDIIQLVHGKPDLVLLEEPEHLTWYHHGKRWAVCFPLVVGIAHTAYVEYVSREAGETAALALGRLNRFLVGAHCHKVIKLSDAVQHLPREETLFVHGVSNGFLEVGKRVRSAMEQARADQQQHARASQPMQQSQHLSVGPSTKPLGTSTIPDSAAAALASLQPSTDPGRVAAGAESVTGPGTGTRPLGSPATCASTPQSSSTPVINAAAASSINDVAPHVSGSAAGTDTPTPKLADGESAVLTGTSGAAEAFPLGHAEAPAEGPSSNPFTKGVYFLGKAVWAKGYRELLDMLAAEKSAALADGRPAVHCDIFGKGDHLEEIKHEAERMQVDVAFHGARDHLNPEIQQYQVFLNPSTSDVVATTSAEALAMNKWLVCAEHPCNVFFSEFSNCLIYRNPVEFVSQLHHALTHTPQAMSEQEQARLSWEDACNRLLAVAFTPSIDSQRTVRKAVESMAYSAYSRLLGIEYIRRSVGAGKNTKVVPLFGEDEESERMSTLELYPVGCY